MAFSKMLSLGSSQNASWNIRSRSLFILMFLCLAVTSFPINGQPREVDCDCNVTKLEVESDPVGPSSPKKLNSTVKFIAITNWAPNASIHMNVYVGHQLLTSYVGDVHSNLSCREDIQEEFEFVNEILGSEAMSGHPIVDILVFVNHPDNPDGGDLSCDNPLCKKFQVFYHFPPAPENVLISNKGGKAILGDVVSIKCSTTDGYPKVEQFGIQAFDTDNKKMFYVPIDKIMMVMSDLWSFQCEAISFPFGKKVVVRSTEQVKVVNETTNSERLGDKEWFARFHSEQETYATPVENLISSAVTSRAKDKKVEDASKLKTRPSWSQILQRLGKPIGPTRKRQTERTTENPKSTTTLTSEEKRPEKEIVAYPAAGVKDEGGVFEAALDDHYHTLSPFPGDKDEKRGTSGCMMRHPVLVLELTMVVVSRVVCYVW